MSIEIENQCVSCQLPCIYNGCKYHQVTVVRCDDCQEEYADYCIDGEDLCEFCAEKMLNSTFEDLTISEKAAVLDMDFEMIGD